jgi:hypothetical protein
MARTCFGSQKTPDTGSCTTASSCQVPSQSLYASSMYSSARAYLSPCGTTSIPYALAALSRYEVTMFQPMRPLVRWSSVENFRANAYGELSYVVDAVMPNESDLVTDAMAETRSLDKEGRDQ